MKVYFNFAEESFETVEPKEYDYVFETNRSIKDIEHDYWNFRMLGLTTQETMDRIEL